MSKGVPFEQVVARERRGRLSIVDLLVLTSLDQLLLTLQRLFTFNKTSYLNDEQATLFRRSTVQSLPLQ